MERLMLTWASRGGVQQGSGHMLLWELGFRPITPCDMCPLDPEPTIEMKRSASKSVSTSSSAGNPTTLSGLRAELIAAAMRSGGVQARQREADCSAAKVSAAVLTCGGRGVKGREEGMISLNQRDIEQQDRHGCGGPSPGAECIPGIHASGKNARRAEPSRAEPRRPPRGTHRQAEAAPRDAQEPQLQEHAAVPW
uniref:Uncharacterized protein n=1 Tax=Auxenochlorella protothecoides TaxID=3075 RepID=A0A1D2A7M7_AUXPR